jgi:catechol 2,3-dioxygenase-like lactoylglutathione lyase family enzyme
MAVTLSELRVADQPASWRGCGYEVDGDVCVVGEVRIRFAPEEGSRGLIGWSLRGIDSPQLDGLPTSVSDLPPTTGAPEHPNGITAIDHVVAISSDLDRTVAALSDAGLDLRRVREEPTPAGAPRQAFFRLGSTILEAVQEPPEVTAKKGGDRPAFFWGLAFLAPDLERTVAYLGEERVSEIRDAVQPGRQIATLRRGAGLSVPVALMSPRG